MYYNFSSRCHLKFCFLLLPLFTFFEIQANTSHNHLCVVSWEMRAGDASEDGEVDPLTLPLRRRVALGYPARHRQAASDLPAVKRGL